MLKIKNRDASRYVRMKLATLYMMCVNVRAKKRKLVSVLFAFFFDLQKVPRKPSGKLLNNPFPISSLHRFLLKHLGHEYVQLLLRRWYMSSNLKFLSIRANPNWIPWGRLGQSRSAPFKFVVLTICVIAHNASNYGLSGSRYPLRRPLVIPGKWLSTPSRRTCQWSEVLPSIPLTFEPYMDTSGMALYPRQTLYCSIPLV